MAKCADTPTMTYTAGDNFTLWFGGFSRARKVAQRKAKNKARAIIRRHNSDHCYPAECDETYIDKTGTYHFKCAASGEFKAAIRTNRVFKTWFGGKGGDYSVGVEGTTKCECVIPQDIGKPFDFLGLINIVGGAGKTKPEHLKSIADLIKWMKENL